MSEEREVRRSRILRELTALRHQRSLLDQEIQKTIRELDDMIRRIRRQAP